MDGIRRRTAVTIALVAVLALVGCESDVPDPLSVTEEDGTPGHYGGPCLADGTCGSGLVCQHHVCVESAH